MKLQKPLVILDLETTGTWIEKDRVIDIAMMRCSPDGSKESFYRRVNPGMPIPSIVTEITGISNADVKDSPGFETIAQSIVEFVGDADIGGFNVERFDLPLLQRELTAHGVSIDMSKRKVYDAQTIYHINEKRDLSAAYQFYCKKELVNAHSAEADVAATLEVLEAQVAQYAESQPPELAEMQKFEYTRTGDFYDSDRKFRWWNGRLYMMFGKYAKRHSLQELVDRDPGYLEWILRADFSAEIKELVGDALRGVFPKAPSV